MERKVGKDAGSTALRRLPYGRRIPENITLVTKFIFVEILFPWKRSLHGIAWARRTQPASGPCPHAWMQHGSCVQGLRSTGALPHQDPPACSPQDTRGGPSWGLPDAGVQRGCQDRVQVQDGAQGQGEVQDRSFEAEHATTRPEWVWRHFTPTPCTNEMSVWKSLSCERVSGKQFREIIPADKGR